MESSNFHQHAMTIMEEIRTHLKHNFAPLEDDVELEVFEEPNNSLRFVFSATFAFESHGKPVHRLGTAITLYMHPPNYNRIEVRGKSFEYPEQLDLITKRIKELTRR